MSSERAFLATSALLFVASAAGTIVLCRSMSGGMAMAGGWTMSMAWMRMPKQTWLGAAAMFTLMWMTMMVAMMLPSLAPILRHLRGRRWLVAAAYFFIWTIFGVVAYAIGRIPEVHLWISSSVPDADINADLYEVRPDGTAVYLSAAQLRLRYRDDRRKPTHLPVAAPVEITLRDFRLFCHRVSKNSRLRLRIGFVSGPGWERNPNTGGPASTKRGWQRSAS